MKRSLRWRLAWSFTLLTTLAVLTQAVALFVATEEREEDLIDEVVNAALDETIRGSAILAASALPGTSMEPVSLSPRLKLYRVEAGELPAALPATFATMRAGNYEWYAGDTEYHVGIRDSAGSRFYLLYDASEHEMRLEHLQWSLLLGLAVLSVASLWLGYWLAGRMLSQLEKITRRLREHGGKEHGGNDVALLNEPDFDREVALLAGALDDYRRRNRELLEREREFTANVSHELRTPLTGVRTGAELLADDAALPARCRERAQRIVKSVDDMESRLRGLLFLARESAPAERWPVHLRQCAESCAAQFQQACDAAGVALAIDIAPHAEVQADPALLQLLLENLIGNAVRYTAQGRITVAYRNGTLAVADTGVGIPSSHLDHVFRRHYRASDIPGGSGVGLSIVKRICDVHGWRCEIESVAAGDAQRGTRVSVSFQAPSDS